jgi:hypothetical protein
VEIREEKQPRRFSFYTTRYEVATTIVNFDQRQKHIEKFKMYNVRINFNAENRLNGDKHKYWPYYDAIFLSANGSRLFFSCRRLLILLLIGSVFMPCFSIE